MKALPRTLHGLRVLVVEDYADLCELFVLLLRTEGAEATKAQTGREALDLSQTRRFDVVLCDLNLPDIPGEVLIRHLLATMPGPPVVAAITGGGLPQAGRMGTDRRVSSRARGAAGRRQRCRIMSRSMRMS